MINSSPNRQQGAAVVVIVIVLIVSSILVMTYAMRYSWLQQKTASNQYNAAQALQASEAGIEYAIAYLQANSATVIASPVGGYINYTIATTTLGNSTTYRVAITNPVQNNYNILTLTSTGTSSDGATTEVIIQQVAKGDTLLDYTATAKGSFASNGNITIGGNYGVNVGGAIVSAGQLHSNNNKPNDTVLASTSNAALFFNVFGMSTSSMQAQSTVYATQLTVPWSTLSGRAWINSTVVLTGSYTIGTPTNPVLLIINGNWATTGNITVYGVLYVMGNFSIQGNDTYTGGVIAEGNMAVSGSSSITYDNSIMNTYGSGTYNRITGSWKDF